MYLADIFAKDKKSAYELQKAVKYKKEQEEYDYSKPINSIKDIA